MDVARSIAPRHGVADPGRVPAMARTAGLLHIAGCALTLILIVYPGPGSMDRLAIGVAVAIPTVVGISLLAADGRLAPWVFQAVAVEATVVLTAVVYLSDAAVSPLPFLYVWIVAWAATFFTPRAAAVQTALIVAAFGAVLLVSSPLERVVGLWLLASGTLLGILALISHLNDAIRSRERGLEDAALTDALTGLPNRRAWQEELPRALSRAAHGGSPLTVALLDLDRFKEYNDTLGHQAGDDLLRAVAVAWRERLRPGDLLTRYGGDEFLLLLPATTPAQARRIVARLLDATPEPLSCSVGVAGWNGFETATGLVARADRDLYDAKHAANGDSARSELVRA